MTRQTFVNVSERQKRQKNLVFVEVRPDDANPLGVGDKSALREHHALGVTGRAGRVDDGRGIVGQRGRPRRFIQTRRFGQERGTFAFHLRRIRERENVLQIRQIGAYFLYFGRLFRVANPDRARAAIAENRLHLSGGQGGEQRHDDQTAHLTREVDDRPHRPVFGQNRDARAAFEIELQERAAQIADAGGDLSVSLELVGFGRFVLLAEVRPRRMLGKSAVGQFGERGGGFVGIEHALNFTGNRRRFEV